jgi:hypothetical protein
MNDEYWLLSWIVLFFNFDYWLEIWFQLFFLFNTPVIHNLKFSTFRCSLSFIIIHDHKTRIKHENLYFWLLGIRLINSTSCIFELVLELLLDSIIIFIVNNIGLVICCISPSSDNNAFSYSNGQSKIRSLFNIK